MMREAEPHFGWEPLIGVLLVVLPWLSFIWLPLIGLWLVLIFLFLFFIPALGRIHDSAGGTMRTGKLS